MEQIERKITLAASQTDSMGKIPQLVPVIVPQKYLTLIPSAAASG